MSPPLLEVHGASKVFRLEDREVPALFDVSFDVQAGECLAIVGESGAGKTTVANLILGVYPPTAGTILMHGEPLPTKRRREHRRAVQLVQQNPLSTLNPKRTVGASLRLALDVHRIGERRERPEIVATLLEEVGLPADFARRYPAALSGGQRQRVAVARALACRSELVVLDEPHVFARRAGAGAGAAPAGGIAGRGAGSPTSSSPTTSRWCATSPTGSRCSRRAGCWRSASRKPCSRRPSTPTRGASSARCRSSPARKRRSGTASRKEGSTHDPADETTVPAAVRLSVVPSTEEARQ